MWPWWETVSLFSNFLFQLVWSPFLLLTWMKMYGSCACMFGSLLMVAAVYRPPPLVSMHPMIPSRLSGRAADRLSDEMMTLLWEVIPKWKVSGKDCTPSHTATPFLPRLAASCADHDWFASDGLQEAPIDFPVFYQKYLFTVVSLGHGRDLYCQFPNGTWWKRDDSPHPMTR